MNDASKALIKELIAKKEFKTAEIYLLTDLQMRVNDFEKEHLVSSKLCLVHYTSLKTIYSILTNDKKDKLDSINYQGKDKPDNSQNCNRTSLGFLRLYDSLSLSDPDEGDYLKNNIIKKYRWLKKTKQKTYAFICSFVSGKEDIGDKLQYWQSYGADGLGCSIQPPDTSSCKKICSRVKYGQDGITGIENKFQSYFRLGKELFEKLPNKKQKEEFATEFWGEFDSIKFLYKSDDYKHEKEFRYVVVPDKGELIRYDFKTEGPHMRRYILRKELQADEILGSVSKIIIGPRVQDKERICLYLDELAKQTNLHGAEFIPSSISYQKLW